MWKALKETYRRRIIPLCRRNQTRAEDDSQAELSLSKTSCQDDQDGDKPCPVPSCPAGWEPCSQQADSFLCERCSKINLEQIFSLKTISSYVGHHILCFRSESEIVEDPNCSFCQAFDFISPPSLVGPHLNRVCSLDAWHISGHLNKDYDRSDKRVLSEDSICLTIGAGHIWRRSKAWASCGRISGCLVLDSTEKEDNDLFRADSVDGTVDFNMIGSWMKACERKHGNHCIPTWAENSTLRLIHCDSRRIIKTPKPPEISTYAALSYVWGSQESCGTSSKKLPKQLPKTIEDAITVTKRLGIPYLWIDRYCINQADEKEKHRQCGLMHKIYEGAHITIIAAAGNGPDYGLPGIGSSKRSYPSVRIGSRCLVPTLPDPRLSLQAAKWSTRGWTYQEGVLSKRRLIFTDRQVLFRCRKGYINEVEQKLQPDTELPEEAKAGGNPTMSLNPFFEFNEVHHQIWDDINRFVKLDLSHQEDALSAMLGILQRYQESIWTDGFRLRHLGGLPAIKREPSMYEKPAYHVYPNWTFTILDNLGWTVKRPTKRRDGFPSWSWTGWKAMDYRVRYSHRKRPQVRPDWEKALSIERPEGDIVKESELESVVEAGHDFSRIRFINLKAPSLEFTIVPQHAWSVASEPSLLSLTMDKTAVMRHSHGDLHCPFELTDASVRIPEYGLRCWGILIIEDPDWDLFKSLVLVVAKVGDWYERIGVAEVPQTIMLEEFLKPRTFRLG